ncbi:MAG TPA: single-stranded DNA-binding protein [Firmicutes bacterium]|nr:single-stranded DNA-binding protein [Bacillota bacterium]
MLNKVVLIGRLVRDPELRYTPSEGVPVANFTIAVDRPYSKQKGDKEADFIRIVTWNKQAENCASYLSKGRLVAVEGRLQIRSYEDREGIKRSAAEVVARSVVFLESRRSAEEDRSGFDGESADEPDIREDDVPF